MEENWIAWAAGLFEGEGSIYVANIRKNETTYSYVRLTVTSTDLDVLDKFLTVVECGKLHLKRRPTGKDHWKQGYWWQLNNAKEVARVIEMFWPYLGERRKEKAIELAVNP